jgi:hypothetical protein
MATRTALTLLVVPLLLAGCVGTGGPPATAVTSDDPTSTPTDASPSATPQTDTLQTDHGYYRAYEFVAQSTTRAEIAEDVTLSRPEVRKRVQWRRDPFVATLFGERTAERVVIGGPDGDTAPGTLDNQTVLRANGTYYALEKSVVRSRKGTAYGMELEGPLGPQFHEDYERAKREAVDFDSLSPADRAAFSYAVPPVEERESAVHTAGYDYVFEDEGTAANATLVDGERHYVRHEGDVFRVQSDGPQGTRVRYRVRYELSPMADSTESFLDGRLESLVTPLNESNATTRTRDVVVRTVQGSTVKWSGRTEAPPRIRHAANWVHDHPPDGSDAYVRYDGSLYRVRVQKVVE